MVIDGIGKLPAGAQDVAEDLYRVVHAPDEKRSIAISTPGLPIPKLPTSRSRYPDHCRTQRCTYRQHERRASSQHSPRGNGPALGHRATSAPCVSRGHRARPSTFNHPRRTVFNLFQPCEPSIDDPGTCRGG